MFQLLHWGIWQITGRKGEGTLKRPSPIHLHSATTGHPLDPNQFNIMHKEVHSQSRTIKEAMFICIQDPPQPQPRQIPTATYMGSASSVFTNVPMQTNTTANNHCQHITPYWYPHTCPPPTLPCYPFRWEASYFFLLLSTMVSTCIPPKHPLSLSTFRPTAVPSW